MIGDVKGLYSCLQTLDLTDDRANVVMLLFCMQKLCRCRKTLINVNPSTILLFLLPVGGFFKNIAKGTTDPRVEFILQNID